MLVESLEISLACKTECSSSTFIPIFAYARKGFSALCGICNNQKGCSMLLPCPKSPRRMKHLISCQDFPVFCKKKQSPSRHVYLLTAVAMKTPMFYFPGMGLWHRTFSSKRFLFFFRKKRSEVNVEKCLLKTDSEFSILLYCTHNTSENAGPTRERD